jgi:hypothetical protein
MYSSYETGHIYPIPTCSRSDFVLLASARGPVSAAGPGRAAGRAAGLSRVRAVTVCALADGRAVSAALSASFDITGSSPELSNKKGVARAASKILSACGQKIVDLRHLVFTGSPLPYYYRGLLLLNVLGLMGYGVFNRV